MYCKKTCSIAIEFVYKVLRERENPLSVTKASSSSNFTALSSGGKGRQKKWQKRGLNVARTRETRTNSLRQHHDFEVSDTTIRKSETPQLLPAHCLIFI